MHVSIVEREPTILGEAYRSDHLREFVECCCKGQSGACIRPELVVSSPQVPDEGMPPDRDAGGSVPSKAPHGTKPFHEAAVVRFYSIVGVLNCVVRRSRQEGGNDSDQGVGPVGGDLDQLAMGPDCT